MLAFQYMHILELKRAEWCPLVNHCVTRLDLPKTGSGHHPVVGPPQCSGGTPSALYFNTFMQDRQILLVYKQGYVNLATLLRKY